MNKLYSIVIMLFMLITCGCVGIFSDFGMGGQYDSDGYKIDQNREIWIGFHNPDSVSYTMSIWKQIGYEKRRYVKRADLTDFKDTIIYPGAVEIIHISQGEYRYSIKRSVGHYWEHRIIFKDEGEFIVNKKKVDDKVDIIGLWHKSGGGSGKDYNF